MQLKYLPMYRRIINLNIIGGILFFSSFKVRAEKDFAAYEQYQQKVPLNRVWLVFAAESNAGPASAMGHLFLKLQGKNVQGIKEHAFSYFAAIDSANSWQFYTNVFTTGIEGAYVLSPYREKLNEYVSEELRSVWEFELDMTLQDMASLKQHLWMLKNKNTQYSLISHNCATAMEEILSSVNPNFRHDLFKPFETPVDYVRFLHKSGKIKNIDLIPTFYTREKIKKYGVKNIIEAEKSTRVDISWQLKDKPFFLLDFSPVYRNLKDINTAYYDETENEIAQLKIGYRPRYNRIFVQSFDVLKMRSVSDFSIQHDYSKYFRLGFENNLEKMTTALKPILEIGVGWGKYFDDGAVYFMPVVGYRYQHYHNLYLAPEAGVFLYPSEHTKCLISYQMFLDSKGNNRGYNQKLNFYLGYKVFKNSDIYLDYSLFKEAQPNDLLRLGYVFHF